MKNKKLKRMVAIFLALSILLCLSACSGKDDGKPKEDKAQNTPVEEDGNVITDEKVSIDKNCKVGDYITFGSYEQDNNTSNGKEDIEWLVLDKQDDKVLVISKYALDCQQYNPRSNNKNITWEICALRSWLNDEFINAAFSANEREMIPTVIVSADENPEFDTNPGNATKDQVFLLSIIEANKYFSTDDARKCEPTNYAVANGVYVHRDSSNCLWWLRSPGHHQDDVTYVRYEGGVNENGYGADNDDCAVRPAMWITL